MAKFTPNPNIESSGQFEVVKPGVYGMRVAELTEFTSSKGNQCLKARLEFVDPSSCTKLDGNPATNPGNVFDNGLVMAPAEKQGKLRSFVEACGKNWSDVSDTDELVGAELQVNVGIEEYNGEQKNVVKRYLK
jgi:hypothetical protein